MALVKRPCTRAGLAWRVWLQRGNRPHSVSRRAPCLHTWWGDRLVPQPAEDDGYDLAAICLGEDADCSDQGTVYVPEFGQDALGGIQIVPDNGGQAFALHLGNRPQSPQRRNIIDRRDQHAQTRIGLAEKSLGGMISILP